jgi:hypothetical protein
MHNIFVPNQEEYVAYILIQAKSWSYFPMNLFFFYASSIRYPLLKKGLEITALGLKEFRKSALASATSATSET